MTITTVFTDERLRIGTVGSLLIVAYKGENSAADLQHVDREEGLLVARYGKISMLSVVLPTKSMARVKDDLKKAALELVQKYRAHLVADVIVIPPQGISGTIVRTFLVAFSLLARNPYPSKVFTRAEDALTWLKQVPGQDITFADTTDARELTDVLEFTALAA